MIHTLIAAIALFLLMACTSSICYNKNEYELNRHKQYQKIGKCENE